MEKKISKYNGKVEVKKNTAIDQLLKNDKAIEKMVDYGATATYSQKGNAEERKVLRSYVVSMLESARD